MRNLLFFTFLFIVFMTNCKDKDSIVVDNQLFYQLFTFDNIDSLSLWDSPDAILAIDKSIKAVGSGSLHFTRGNSWSDLKLKDGLAIKANKNYQVSFMIRADSLINSNFKVIIKQGTREILNEYLDLDNWDEFFYYFHSDDTGLPVQLEFKSGVKDVWIDNLLIKEIQNNDTQPLVVSYSFNNLDSLVFWRTGNGVVSIDSENNSDNIASLHVQPFINCCSFQLREGIKVKPKKNYKLSYSHKRDDNFTGCSGYFMIKGKQGTETVIDESPLGSLSWKSEVFYFSSNENGLPIKFTLYFGTENSWIDQLRIEEIK